MTRRALALVVMIVAPARGDDAGDAFEAKVRPILAEHCLKCHGPEKQQGGLRFDGADAFRVDDGSGSVVVPGNADESRLIRAVRRQGEHPMPPKSKLADADVALLTEWVQGGAVWAPGPGQGIMGRGKDHWAFRPVKAADPPEVAGLDGDASPIDRFLGARLAEKGLTLSPPADRRTLLRRLTFDLTGLPPTPGEIDAFLKDESAGAVETVVDRLLASQQYAERWARHWLDVARYADTNGPGSDEDDRYPFAYTYRDWVVAAFQADLPYDQFLIKQIAADRLERKEGHPDLAALGFLTLGRKFEGNDEDIIDDRIDTLFRGTQGLTVACARCHDHKYDPIPTRDYYSLHGVFAGAEEAEVPIISGPEGRAKYLAYAAELRARERDFARFEEAERRRLFGAHHHQQADRYLLAAQATGDSPPAKDAKREDGLHQAIVNAYRDHLNATKEEHNSVMAPWHAYAALAPEDYSSAKGKQLARAFAANEDEEKPINPRVAKLFPGKPPASLEEVARRYGRLFAATSKKWQKLLAAADKADRARPSGFDDEDEEEIRELLFGEDPAFDISQGDLREMLDEERGGKYDTLKAAIGEWKGGPEAPPHARVLEEPEEPETPHVFIRGKPDQEGDEVPRQFPEILAGPERKPFTDGTGRLDLARAIAAPENPLTARVWVNRVWGHLFGRPLVDTPSDFGLRSRGPSHPELLDWLANSLVQEGWSTKGLIRKIVLTRAYQQASATRPEGRKADTDNQLLWRMNRKRLPVEPFRDALLAVSGSLDATVGGRPVRGDDAASSTRRALYLAVDRGNLPSLFRAYDFANPDLHSPGRHETTVPQQALFLLNSPFVAERARGLSRRAEAAGETNDAWVGRLYRIVFGREASPSELALGVKFLSSAAAIRPVGPTPPPVAWRYGAGTWDEAMKQVVALTPLAHFQDDNWRPGAEYPDPSLGYLTLSAEGGHAAPPEGPLAVRRWVAPADGVATVSGLLKHEQEGEEEGSDGVRGRVVSPRGIVAEAVAYKAEARTDASGIRVKAGEPIDFVVDCRKGDGYDSFSWRVSVTLVPAGKAGAELGFDSADDFRGPPVAAGPPLSAREKYAQVLLMGNEFLYVD